MTGIGGIAIGMAKFSTGTDRTRVKFGCNGDLWDTLGVPMKIRDTTGVEVAETLVPEDAELIPSQMTKDICLFFLRGKEKVLKRRRQSGGRRGWRGRTMATNWGRRLRPDRNAIGMGMKGFKGNICLGTQALEPQHFLGDGRGRHR
jgi:hypothetical protein